MSDYGIINSLEYIKEVLILQEFKKDFNYFCKEIKFLINESENLDKVSNEFLLFKVERDDYDNYLETESLILNINKNYLKILSIISDCLSFTFKGIGSKDILKEYLKESSTEYILNLVEQPKNTCPLIDEAIEKEPIYINELEILRTSCEETRDFINKWKKELWSCSEINFSLEGFHISFFNIPKFEINYYDFNFKGEKSSKALLNYKRIIEWGINYYNFVLKNSIIKVEHASF